MYFTSFFEIFYAFTFLHLGEKYETSYSTAFMWQLCSLITLQSKVVHKSSQELIKYEVLLEFKTS